MVAPEMEKLAEKYDGVVDVAKVDVDANPGLSQAYQIMSIPTIAYFKPGDQPKGVVGFQPMEQLEKKFGLDELPAAAGGEAASAPRPSSATETHRRPGLDPGASLLSAASPEASRLGRVPPGGLEPGRGPVGHVPLVGRRREADPAAARRSRPCPACAGPPRRYRPAVAPPARARDVREHHAASGIGHCFAVGGAGDLVQLVGHVGTQAREVWRRAITHDPSVACDASRG